MSNGRIYITISDERKSGPGPDTPLPSTSQINNENDSNVAFGRSNWSYASHRFANFVESQAKQFINYEINNIGLYTGNYFAQQEVQTAVQGVHTMLNLANAAFVGAKMGGIPGAIAGLVIGIASTAINIIEKEHVQLTQYRQNNYKISVLQQRSGLYSTNNESRTGGY